MIKAIYISAICFYLTATLTSCTLVCAKMYDSYKINKQIEEDAKDILKYPAIG